MLVHSACAKILTIEKNVDLECMTANVSKIKDNMHLVKNPVSEFSVPKTFQKVYAK